jgi:hypothetical protein
MLATNIQTTGRIMENEIRENLVNHYRNLVDSGEYTVKTREIADAIIGTVGDILAENETWLDGSEEPMVLYFDDADEINAHLKAFQRAVKKQVLADYGTLQNFANVTGIGRNVLTGQARLGKQVLRRLSCALGCDFVEIGA